MLSSSSYMPARNRQSLAASILLFLVNAYRLWLSPMWGGACKFYPSCSQYAAQAISIHGARRGAWLALKRLFRCVPFTKGGIDLVPEPPSLAPQPAPASPSTFAEPAQ
jgi:uncharacterized protein